MLASRRARWGLGIGAGLLLVLALGFGPVARSRLVAEAARRGFDLKIGGVRPGWWSVKLSEVEARPSGVPAVAVFVADMRIGLSVGFAPREIDVTGGRLSVSGTLSEVREELEAWRQRRPPPSKGGGRTLVVHADGLAFQWRETGGIAVDASGIGVDRGPQGTQLSVAAAHGSRGDLGLDVKGASVDFDPSWALRSAKLGTVEASLQLAQASSSPASPPPTGADLPLPPPPANAHARNLPSSPEAGEPLLRLPSPRALRAEVGSLASLLADHLPESSSVQVDGLSLRLRGSGEHLTLGPGPVAVSRAAGHIEVAFSTSATSSGTPLSLKAELPTGSEDVQVSLAGGPVSLSLLGVKEGAAGLTEVDRATVAGRGRVVLDGKGDALTFDGELNARGLAVNDARLAPDPVRGIDFTVSARGVLSDKGELRLDDVEASMGALHVRLHGGLEQTSDHVAAGIDFEMTEASCEALLESVPSALLPTVSQSKMAGSLGGSGRLAFDSRKLDDLSLSYEIADHCRMVDVPEDLDKARFAQSFTHRVYLRDGTLAEEETGPGTPGWTDLDHISPYMQVAVLTTEDGGFFHHHGFNHAAIRNALVADLKARKFVRGASTITMQLAKNLFLSRDKTLSRKLEEVVLTDYLEQVFTKDEMMELYLNIIEFGPDTYGIMAAADHYFGRRPDELNLAECLFLSSILPQPLHYHRLYEKGELPDSWMRSIHERMEIAAKLGRITAAELAEGLAEPIVFHPADAPPPTPRTPLAGVRHEERSTGWQELN